MRFSKFQKTQNSGDEDKDKNLPITLRDKKQEPAKLEIVKTTDIVPNSEQKSEDSPKNIASRDVKFSIKSEKTSSDLGSPTEYVKINRENLEISAKEIYGKAIGISKDLINQCYLPYFEKYHQIDYIVSKIYTQLKDNPLFVGCSCFITADNYLYSHNVNTAIVAMNCAMSLNYPKQDVISLGCAAFLHDIGIIDFLDIIRNERELSTEEKEIVKQHSYRSVEYLDKITDLEYEKKQLLSKIIIKTHERYDGSGWPAGIKGDEDDLSSILSIADVWEALTHKRNWREAYEQPVVVRFFLDEFKLKFSPRALKSLILSNGMYPVNSLVRLSTGEIARVLLNNKKNLTRPLVEIILDANFMEIKPFLLDLTEYPLTSIENEISFSQLLEKNPSFYSLWEISYFWLDWRENA